MPVEHVNITDPEIHEPKGVATASAADIYVADGAGSGTWRTIPHSALYYDDIGAGTTITTPTTYTLIGPATTGDADPHEFTHNSLGRLTYTGSETEDVDLIASLSLKHTTGSGQDCYFQLFKNGAAVAGAQHVVTADSATYIHISLYGHVSMTTNDYFEVFCKTSSGSIVIHSLSLACNGHL